MKKIISFSLWGKKPFYTQGAIENVKLQPKIYPGWTCRFYVDESVPKEIREELTYDSEVILCQNLMVIMECSGDFCH